jgi:hypothetical protein
MLYSMDSPGLCRVLPWRYCRNRQGQLVASVAQEGPDPRAEGGNDPGEPTLGV